MWALPALLAGCINPETPSEGYGEEVGSVGWEIRNGDFFWSNYGTKTTWTDRHPWPNPRDAATIEVRNGLQKGELTVTIEDGLRRVVWSRSFGAGDAVAPARTDSGEPGDWTIEIARKDAVGQFDVHVLRGA